MADGGKFPGIGSRCLGIAKLNQPGIGVNIPFLAILIHFHQEFPGLIQIGGERVKDFGIERDEGLHAVVVILRDVGDDQGIHALIPKRPGQIGGWIQEKCPFGGQLGGFLIEVVHLGFKLGRALDAGNRGGHAQAVRKLVEALKVFGEVFLKEAGGGVKGDGRRIRSFPGWRPRQAIGIAGSGQWLGDGVRCEEPVREGGDGDPAGFGQGGRLRRRQRVYTGWLPQASGQEGHDPHAEDQPG